MTRASKNWRARARRGDLGPTCIRQRRGLRRLVPGFGFGRGPGPGGPGRIGGENPTVSRIIDAISIYSARNVKRPFGSWFSWKRSRCSLITSRRHDHDRTLRLRTKLL
jgi:hypothetical protein